MTVINREALASALKRACIVAPRTPTMPILAAARLEAIGGVLTIETTDLATASRLRVPCRGDLSPVCVDARLLGKIAASPGANEVEIDTWMNATCTMQQAHVQHGQARFTLPTFAAADFPSTAGVGDAALGERSPIPAGLISSAAALAPFVNSRSVHGYQCGVWIGWENGSFAGAIDNHRVMIRRTGSGAPTICVPPSAVRALGVANLVAPGSVMHAHHDGQRAVFALPGGDIATAITTDSASLVSEVVSKHIESTPMLAVDRDILLAAVTRLGASDADTIQMHGDDNGGGGRLICAALVGDDKIASDVVPATVRSSVIACLPICSLADALAVLTSTEVRISTSDRIVWIEGTDGELAGIAMTVIRTEAAA